MQGWYEYLKDGIWTDDLRRYALPRRIAAGTLRILMHAAAAFSTDIGPLRPAGLTMITLLSLVPLLALVSSIADAVGYQEVLQDFITRNISQFPPQTKQGLEQLQDAVANANFQTIGLVSVGVLLWTILTLFIRVEAALNFTWKTRQARPWLRRISDFIALIVLFPVLAIIALAANSVLTSASWIRDLQEHPYLGLVYDAGLGGLSHVVMWVAMTALFRFMPSADVRWRWAFVGGVVAGSGWLFAHTIWIGMQIGMARTNQIYAAVAAFPLLIVYLQVVWTVILFGAEVSYAGQHLHLLGPNNSLREPSYALRERIALATVERVAARFESGVGPTGIEAVARELDLPPEWVGDVCDSLTRAGILAFVDNDRDRVLPAKPVEAIHVLDVLTALRGSVDDEELERILLSPSTLDRLAEAEQAQRMALRSGAFAGADGGAESLGGRARPRLAADE